MKKEGSDFITSFSYQDKSHGLRVATFRGEEQLIKQGLLFIGDILQHLTLEAYLQKNRINK